ncbi:MAG: nucleotidyl transferase AbiEii/AbiGii toxin family protein, partial [Verrucomicrobiota bacterium]|nr:nucleotidyl transferase AbiEii/AbiGii toxin family protein [Verrucomicrobiota bacterium]
MDALMLHCEAAPAPLVELLRRLMQEDLLSPFFLVGGTALALRLGHRVSVDIVLFSDQAFDVRPITGMLRGTFPIQSLETAQNTVRGEVGGIKLDIMSHRYPTIESPATEDGIRIASLKDIAAMKLNAIANRGSKKDFWDYAELLSLFSRDEMLGFFAEKYSDENVWYVEKSLSYFSDADKEPDPRDLKGRTWDEVKKA